MPLLQEFTLAAHNHFEQLAHCLAAAATPRPEPKPFLTIRQTLARESPKPDRLVAIKAARVPLIEAARPLLLAIAHMPAQLDVARADALHRELSYQVTAFQSLCADAHVRQEYISGASYMLCTALDEAAGLSARAMDASAGAGTWSGRLLAARFHGDGRGGESVFKIMANLLRKPAEHIDLLELLLIVISLGFEGMYRTASNGKRALDQIRHVVLESVRSCRGEAVSAAHWNAIESLLWLRMSSGSLADTQEALFH